MRLKFACRPQQSLWLKRLVSSSLALGILFNSVLAPISSFAGVLLEDGRYEVFEDNNITIPNILEEDSIDVEIEGNTLVNLCGEMNSSDTQWVLKNGWWELSKEGVLFLDFKAIVKPNTTYTVILNAKLDNSDGIVFGFRKDNLQWEGSYHSLRLNGINKFKFTTTNNEVNRFTIHRGTTIGETTTIGVKDILILEGDWTNKEVPGYFEGMKSVGELENNTLELVSRNKNLLPNSNGWEDGQITVNGKLGTGEVYLNCSISTKNYIKLKGGTSYTFSYPSNYEVAYHTWDMNYNYIGDSHWISNNTITPTKDCYIKVTTRQIGSNASLDIALSKPTYPNHIGNTLTIQLEEGDVATSYSQYENTRQSILLNEPLLGLPNGIKDRIVRKNGKWFIERNCKKVILNGTETWVNASISPTNIFETPIPDIIAYSQVGQVLCDTFPTGYTNMEIWETYDGIVNLKERRVLCIRNSKTNTKSDLREWLQKNPIEVIYQLSKPIYEPIDFNSLQLYLDTTHISTNSTIPVNLKTTVDRVMNRAIESTNLAKENPTIENLSKARMWTNLLRESIKKDELQTELNSNVDLTGLQLERKTATANLDLYIKSENILQMSLDTNQVTFDDFSSIEDMVKENAVNISINSSLPYQLNAYLPTEIQNADKSNTMDKSILNIKENSESIYQVFANTTDKIVLKDNCSAGNDLVHGVDIKLVGGIAHQKDVYKTTIKFEAEQK